MTARPLAAPTCALALLATAAAGAPAAEAKTLKIVTERGFVVRMGPLKVKSRPYLRDAIAAFGRPRSVREGNGVCNVAWSRLRLKAKFTSFGDVDDFCAEGRFQTAVVRSRVWQTWAGLRVGMRSSQVPRLHRRARFERGKWVLATQSVIGPEPSPTVTALVRDGRVTGLSLWVGQAGD